MVLETRLYDILAISPGATGDEISKSYKKIALRCHPDKTNHDPQLTEKFKQVTRAYEVLKDTKSRKVYDKYGESGLDGSIQPTSQKSTSTRPGPGGNNFKFRSATDVFSQVFSDFNNAFGNDPMNQSMGAGSPFGSNGPFGSGGPFGSDGPFGANSPFGDPFGGGGMNMGNMNMHFNMGFGNNGGPASRSSNTDTTARSFNQGMKKTVRPAHNSSKLSNGSKLFKGHDIYHTCKLTLEDLCLGKTIKLQLPRRTKCKVCKGDGGFDKCLCKTCQGSGRVVTTFSNQFTKYQEVGLCHDCSGTGTLFSSICKNCDDGFLVENKIIVLSVLPGTKEGDQIVVKSAADEGRNIVPGDVIIKIKQERHPYLIRKFNDLFMEYDIDLKTALLGGAIIIKDYLKKGNDLRVFINVHGDNNLNDNIHQSIQSGEIVGTINPGTPKIVKGLGMPINPYVSNGVFYQTDESPTLLDPSGYTRGNLFIKFNVQLPSINDFKNGIEDLNILDQLLPSNNDYDNNNNNNNNDASHPDADMRDDSRELVDTHLGNLPEFTNGSSFRPPSPHSQPSFSSSDNGSSETLGSEPEHKRRKGS